MAEKTTLPIIDMSHILDKNTPHKAIRKIIEKSFEDIGFAYIKNHGVSHELINELFSISKKFFSKEDQEKSEIDMKKSGLSWRGYFPLGGELTSGIPDQKEGIYFGENHDSKHPGVINNWPFHGENIWPQGDEFDRFPTIVSQYLQELTELGHNLMEAFAISLDLPRNYFRERFNSPTILFRIFNYPRHSWSETENQWGVREHTDMGFLTILKQDNSGGLQAKLKSGQWIDVPPIADTFVINIGDMLEYWTHGIYRATPHRVKNQGDGDRLSLPFFFDPSWTSTLEPIDKKHLGDRHSNSYEKRWDGLKIMELSSEQSYGDFVWGKVKQVFPNLPKKSD